MKAANSRRLAWGSCALTALLFVFALAGGLQFTPKFTPLSLQVQWWAIAILSVAFLTFSVVGALVASHSPHNTIGWLFLGIGGAAGLALASLVYTETTFPGLGRVGRGLERRDGVFPGRLRFAAVPRR